MLQMIAIWLLVLRLTPTCSTATNLEIAVFDWILPSPSNLPLTDLSDPSVLSAMSNTMNFFIAADHFNKRRSDILPALGLIPSTCNMNISISMWCDTENNEYKAMSGLKNAFQMNVNALTGSASPQVILDLALVSGALKSIPLVSSRATDTYLGNKAVYPYFARTCNDDQTYVLAITEFVRNQNYSQVVILSSNYIDNIAFVTALQGNLATAGIIYTSISYVDGDLNSTATAFQNIADLELNIIVCVAKTDSLVSMFPSLAAEYRLTTSHEKLWIFSHFDRPLYESEITTNLSLFLNNSIQVSGKIANASLFNAYVSRWASGEFLGNLPGMNARFPPQGYANDSNSCVNDASNLQIDSELYKDFIYWAQSSWG